MRTGVVGVAVPRDKLKALGKGERPNGIAANATWRTVPEDKAKGAELNANKVQHYIRLAIYRDEFKEHFGYYHDTFEPNHSKSYQDHIGEFFNRCREFSD